MMGLSWKPVRRGKIFCSPACGGECTYASYLLAKDRAATASKRLGGEWTPVVWENLGWHSKIVSEHRVIEIHINRELPSRYIVFTDKTASQGLRTVADAARWASGYAARRIAELKAIAKDAEQ